MNSAIKALPSELDEARAEIAMGMAARFIHNAISAHDAAGIGAPAPKYLREALANIQRARQRWYVEESSERLWFPDEFTARTYLLLMRAAFDLRPGTDILLGRGLRVTA